MDEDEELRWSDKARCGKLSSLAVIRVIRVLGLLALTQIVM